ncbi:MAG: hypothetical protein II954_09250 [Synergistaceae bacterium]|nr:hypothetical protein [Synergistaceae bacterium]
MNNNIDNKELEGSIADIIVEAWRFSRAFRDILSKLGKDDYVRFKGRYSWFCRRLEEISGTMGMRIVEIAPETSYDPGMAVTPINITDFGADDSLQIENMLEPVIMNGDSVIKTGTVMLRSVDK